jgi:hypothetical protein
LFLRVLFRDEEIGPIMAKFGKGFLNWMQAVCEVVTGVVAIDGKQLRRSHDTRQDREAIHMVSAWGEANGMVLGQHKVDEISNEITAIPR